jgi:dTDP-4-dehydrorhamnose 3,5-epimerase-like enzyme
MEAEILQHFGNDLMVVNVAKVSYNKESEAGLIYNDETLNINWKFPFKDLIISDKDLVLPTIQNCNKVW